MRAERISGFSGRFPEFLMAKVVALASSLRIYSIFRTSARIVSFPREEEISIDRGNPFFILINKDIR